MTLYSNIIKSLLNGDTYQKYHTVVDKQFLKENFPETYRIYLSLELLHGTSPKDYSVDDLVLRFNGDYPQANRSEYDRIFNDIVCAEAAPDQVHAYLQLLLERQHSTSIAKKAIEVADGKATMGDLDLLFQTAKDTQVQEDDPFAKYIADDDLETYLTNGMGNGGLSWRLDSLNKNLGPIPKGSFGFIFARPETGKTTLLVSELTFMAGQGDGPILWFNNEQERSAVLQRMYEGALRKTSVEVLANVSSARTAFYEATKKNLILYDDASISKDDVEQAIKRFKPKLVVFDQIDKIKGFSEDRNDLELKAIYIWAREIAKAYCPVIAICQAGGSGENKRWLTMNDVDNSKTGKQGEADWILGVGKVHDEGLEQVRYFHLSKNKLPSGKDQDPMMRHGKWEVKIVAEVGRYEDF